MKRLKGSLELNFIWGLCVLLCPVACVCVCARVHAYVSGSARERVCATCASYGRAPLQASGTLSPSWPILPCPNTQHPNRGMLKKMNPSHLSIECACTQVYGLWYRHTDTIWYSSNFVTWTILSMNWTHTGDTDSTL